MKQIHRFQTKLTPTAASRRWVFFLLFCALTGLGLALSARLIDTQSLRLTLAALGRADLWYTALFLALVCTGTAMALHSLFLGGLITGVPAVLLALVNHFKLAITSTPLQLTEFALAGRLGKIASLNAQALTFSRNTVLAIAAPVVWLVVLLVLSRPLRPDWPRSLMFAPVPLLALLLLFQTGGDRLVFTPLDASFSATLSQGTANDRCGVLLGLWRAYVKQEENPLLDTYTASYMDLLVGEAEEELPQTLLPAGRTKPNVILILSESFFDVTQLPGVEYEQDPLQQFHALQEEGVSGTFHTRTLGYGTCNIELEILTGINTTLLNREDLYSMLPSLLTQLPTVPSVLRENGYETTMFHLFNDSIYNRTPIFEELGFDHIYFSGDFAAVDPEAAAAPDYWSYMVEKIDGAFYSDRYMTDLFIDLYEQKGDAPLFLYGISMENHSPHDGTKYAAQGYTVSFTSPLGEEAAAILADASQGAANASQALGRLCDYFREQEEPTVILFFGDHRPGLAMDNGVESVYSLLGMAPGVNQSQWTEEEMAALHATSYLIWSNDPSYLPAEAGTKTESSSNYFGLHVLEAAGVELPLYWRMLAQAYETRLIDTLEYHLGQDGIPSRTADLSETEQARMTRLALCLHDAIYGRQYVTERLWK